MKKFLPIIFAILLYCVALISPSVINAAPTPTPCAQSEVQTDFGCFPNDPIGFTQKFYGYGVGFVGGLALLMLIWGGYTILTSRGEPNQLNVGKSYILYAIMGLLLAIFGYVFFELIAVDVLHIPGFSK
jgi:hypothetical protein